MILTVVMAGAKLIAVKYSCGWRYSKSDGGGDTNDDGKGGDDSDGESNDGADGHKNDGDDDDGCLNYVKNCFKNKQIVLENFSLSDSARWRKSLQYKFSSNVKSLLTQLSSWSIKYVCGRFMHFTFTMLFVSSILPRR